MHVSYIGSIRLGLLYGMIENKSRNASRLVFLYLFGFLIITINIYINDSQFDSNHFIVNGI